MIWQATEKELPALTALALQLWPGHRAEELQKELAACLADPEALLLLAGDGDRPVGFAQCQLRHDYVEGAHSRPVGYLEGVYVEAGYRGQGLAAALLARCQDWAREQGCQEFASDCALDNLASRRFHERAGFAEAGQLVHYIRAL